MSNTNNIPAYGGSCLIYVLNVNLYSLTTNCRKFRLLCTESYQMYTLNLCQPGSYYNRLSAGYE